MRKKAVPKFRSASSIRSALPSSGNANRMSADWVRIVQEKISRFAQVTFSPRWVKMVAMKLIAPIVAATPERWRPSNMRSTPAPPTASPLGPAFPSESGVYIVHPVCAGSKSPSGWAKKPAQIRSAAGGRSQKAMALIRGKAISSAPIISGIR